MHFVRQLVLILVALTLVGSQAWAQDTWDAEATASLEAHVDAAFAAMNAGNFEGMRTQDPDASTFDLDMEGNPVGLYGVEACNAYADAMIAGMNATGMTMSTTIVRKDCHAIGTLGYCTIEFDSTMTMGEETMGPIQQRATMVARMQDGEWHWVHWHASFRAWPEMEGME